MTTEEQDIFAAAMSVPQDEPEASAPQSEPAPEPEPAPEDQDGPEIETTTDAEAPQEGQGQQKRTPRVPLPELLTERDRRASAEAERDMLRRDLDEMKRQLQEFTQRQQQPQQQPQQDQAPGFWDNPEAFLDNSLGAVVERFQRQIQANNFQSSMQLGELKYGADFAEAYKAADARVDHDQAFKFQLLSAPDPAAVIMDAYRQQKLAQEVGDPATYRQKLMADPEFQKEVIEMARKAQGQQPAAAAAPGQSPAPTVQLPPSLSRATSAASNAAESNRDPTDAELFGEAFGALGR